MKKFAKDYLDLLTGEFSTINLTRIEDFDSFYNKQIIDSITPLEVSQVFKESIETAGSMVDVGFGGGFPILPLAKTLPAIKFIGLEARAKKAKVVTQIAEKLDVKNVKLLHLRLEDVYFDVPAVITIKAVGKIDQFLQYINSNQKIRVFFYKGPNYNELEDLDKMKRSWKIIDETRYEIEGTEGRVLIGFENIKVPRGTTPAGKIKFSSLL